QELGKAREALLDRHSEHQREDRRVERHPEDREGERPEDPEAGTRLASPDVANDHLLEQKGFGRERPVRGRHRFEVHDYMGGNYVLIAFPETTCHRTHPAKSRSSARASASCARAAVSRRRSSPRRSASRSPTSRAWSRASTRSDSTRSSRSSR